MFVHYFGAFLSGTPTAENSGDQKASIETWYCPYDFTDGVPDKAHAMVMDPSSPNPNIQIVHGSGMFFSMMENDGSGVKAMMLTVDAETFLRMAPGEVQVFANSITMQGNVALGRITAPIAAAPALNPSSVSASVFISIE